MKKVILPSTIAVVEAGVKVEDLNLPKGVRVVAAGETPAIEVDEDSEKEAPKKKRTIEEIKSSIALSKEG